MINPDLEWLADLTEPDFERLFNGSPVRRTGFLGLRRNIAIAMGNSGLTRFVPWLERWAQVENEAAHDPARAAVWKSARWALSRVAPVERRQDAGND